MSPGRKAKGTTASARKVAGVRARRTKAKNEFSNHEVVTLAVYLLGGEAKAVETEHVAKKANELAPGRFVWKYYPDQINLEIIRVYLSDAKKVDKGAYLTGAGNRGWQLTDKGAAFAKRNAAVLDTANLGRPVLTKQEERWRKTERGRIEASDALAAFLEGGIDAVNTEDIEEVFRVNAYVRGEARERKISRLVNTFGSDDGIGQAVLAFAKRLREKV